jgi:hypothetical protein
VVIRSNDPGTTKSYALLRHALNLGWLDAGGGNTCVCKQAAGLRWCGTQGQGWLAVGQLVRTEKTEFCVLAPTDRDRRK